MPDARIDSGITRDVELLSVSNVLSGQLTTQTTAQNTALISSITTTSNELSGRIVATNAALVTLVNDVDMSLMSKITTTSNALQSVLDNEVMQLQTGDNSFAGSNHFSGIVVATNIANVLVGDGSGLTSMDAGNVTTGTLSDARLSGNVALLGAGSQTFTGSLGASGFSGSGAGLTSLNAGNVSSGTLGDGRLSANVALLDATSQTFTGALSAASLSGNGAGLSSVDATTVDGIDSTALWKLAGNSGTTPGTDFIGSTDNQALVFKANNLQIMRLTPAPDEGAPNILLGAEINYIAPSVVGSTISGGGATDYMNEGPSSNWVSSSYSTIGGGVGNEIDVDANAATIGGGIDNTLSKNSDYSTIGGGRNNLIGTNALYAAIPGGKDNQAAGNYSYAAGYKAKANHAGAFVWADSQAIDLASTNSNTFVVRARNGIYFNAVNNAQIFINGSRLLNEDDDGAMSDRTMKKNFRALDTVEVLEKLANMPVESWHYKTESDDAVQHIGPYAQDFKGAFYPGRDDTRITWLEFHGVALAAIQGVNLKLERELGERDTAMKKLREEMEALKELVKMMSKSANAQ